MSLTRRFVEYLKRYRAPRDVHAYFTTHSVRKLNVGCGSNIVSGWLNTDAEPQPGAVYLNGSKHWPYPASSFAAVLAEHVIEHLSKDHGAKLLGEAYRILTPGGCLRVVTPDLTFLMQLVSEQPLAKSYLAAVSEFHGRTCLTTCDAVNLAFYSYGHQYIYMPSELRSALERAGFVDIVETRAGQPNDQIFVGAEGHGKVIGDDVNAQEAFALEGRKPSI
jgi:predicted SAM-dependent methyltransferase